MQLVAMTAALSSSSRHAQTQLHVLLVRTRTRDNLQTVAPTTCTGQQGRGGHEPALGALSGGASRASAAQQKVYIERAVLSSIDASLSFVPAPWTASRPAGQQR
jgi:hypothetical protein